MNTIIKYRPHIKPSSCFKNTNHKIRYELVQETFNKIEGEIDGFYELIDWCHEEIERLRNKTFRFWVTKRSMKRDYRIIELHDNIGFVEKAIEFNTKMYTFLAGVLEEPDKHDLLEVVKMIYDFKFN